MQPWFKLHKAIDRYGLDAFVAVKNARYLGGTTAAAAVIVSRGEATLLCKRLELERARRESKIRDIRAYFAHRVPLQRGELVRFKELWQLMAERLEELDARAIGFDGMSAEFLRKLRAAHRAGYRELPELMLDLRKIKSRQEIKWLRRASAIAVRGMQRVAELIEVGRSELEIAAEAEYTMRKAGSEGTPFSTIVASGRNSWLPHATVTEKRLRKGELVVVDLGARYNGYASDMTRTFAISPNRRQLRLIEVVKRAQEAAIKRVRDGVRAGDIDEVARGVVSRAGYSKFYLHGTGHGVGLDIHELPNLTPKSKDILRPGMVVTVEPGVYVRGVGGVRWEDMVLVKAGGKEVLTKFKTQSLHA